MIISLTGHSWYRRVVLDTLCIILYDYKVGCSPVDALYLLIQVQSSGNVLVDVHMGEKRNPITGTDLDYTKLK